MQQRHTLNGTGRNTNKRTKSVWEESTENKLAMDKSILRHFKTTSYKHVRCFE